MSKCMLVFSFCVFSLSAYTLKYRCPYVGGEADNEIYVDTHFKIACLSDSASCDLVELSKVNYLNSGQTELIFSGETSSWGDIQIEFNLNKLSAELIHKNIDEKENKLKADEPCFSDQSIILF